MSEPAPALPAADALPVALSGTNDLWLGKTIELRIGAPIDAGQLQVDELTETSRQRLLELLPPYLERTGWKPLRRLLTRLLY